MESEMSVSIKAGPPSAFASRAAVETTQMKSNKRSFFK
jgi:hypothetical protein